MGACINIVRPFRYLPAETNGELNAINKIIFAWCLLRDKKHPGLFRGFLKSRRVFFSFVYVGISQRQTFADFLICDAVGSRKIVKIKSSQIIATLQ